jgi:hypothetical protein
MVGSKMKKMPVKIDVLDSNSRKSFKFQRMHSDYLAEQSPELVFYRNITGFCPPGRGGADPGKIIRQFQFGFDNYNYHKHSQFQRQTPGR